MAGPSDLYDLCRAYLEACEAAVVPTPGGAFERAYVSPGPPAWDCEQLTVHAGGPAEGDTAPLVPPLAPGMRAEVQGAVHLINMTATALRCVPGIAAFEGQVPEPPEAHDLDEAAKMTHADVWAIWNHVRKLYREGALFASPSGRRELFFDPAVPLNTAGGLAGWQIQIRVRLDGYGG